jgi:hypothetical protein
VANPTPDEAINECFDELKFGARPRPITQEGLFELRRLHWPIFEERFAHDPNAWQRDGPMVRRMSRYIGVFARFFAETGGTWRISIPELLQALAIVRVRCPVALQHLVAANPGLPEFVYCSEGGGGDPYPGPTEPPRRPSVSG